MNQNSDDTELKAAFAEFKELLRRETEPVGASKAPEVRLEPTFDPPPRAAAEPVSQAESVRADAFDDEFFHQEAPKPRRAEPPKVSRPAAPSPLSPTPQALGARSPLVDLENQLAKVVDAADAPRRRKLIYLSLAIVALGLAGLGLILAKSGAPADEPAVANIAPPAEPTDIVPQTEQATTEAPAAPTPSQEAPASAAASAENPAAPPAEAAPAATAAATPADAPANPVAPAVSAAQSAKAATQAATSAANTTVNAAKTAADAAKSAVAPVVTAPAAVASKPAPTAAPARNTAALQPEVLDPAVAGLEETPKPAVSPPAQKPAAPKAVAKPKPVKPAPQTAVTKPKPKPATTSAAAPAEAPQEVAIPAPAPAAPPQQSDNGALGFVKNTVNSVGSTIGNIGRSVIP